MARFVSPSLLFSPPPSLPSFRHAEFRIDLLTYFGTYREGSRGRWYKGRGEGGGSGNLGKQPTGSMSAWLHVSCWLLVLAISLSTLWPFCFHCLLPPSVLPTCLHAYYGHVLAHKQPSQTFVVTPSDIFFFLKFIHHGKIYFWLMATLHSDV